eukprot:447490_1
MITYVQCAVMIIMLKIMMKCLQDNYKKCLMRKILIHHKKNEKNRERDATGYCSECNEYYNGWKGLVNHKKRKHGMTLSNNVNNNDSFDNSNTEMQPKTVINNDNRPLKRQQNINRPYKCKYCICRYKCKGSLNQHMKIHSSITGGTTNVCSTNKKIYKCNVCSKRYTYKASWSEHMKLHLGEKQYECEKCKKRFNQKDELDGHIQKNVCILYPTVSKYSR